VRASGQDSDEPLDMLDSGDAAGDKVHAYYLE
jgi:hypothetical protein